jgi:rRNA maturation endonuclease Nob1
MNGGFMAIDKCMQCEATIPGGSKVCPACGNPAKHVDHKHEWAPVLSGSKEALKANPKKFICHSCGRTSNTNRGI